MLYLMEIQDNLDKTIKIKKNQNIFVSVRGKDVKKKTVNYLSPTASSINKQSQKCVNRPSSASSKASNLSRTIPSLKRKDSKLSNINRSFSKTFDSNVYYDDLNHFGNDDNIGYDIYNHFS